MKLKGIFKDIKPGIQLLLLISFTVFGLVFSEVFFYLFQLVKTGFSFPTVNDILKNVYENGELLREYMFFQTLCSFLFPAIFLAYLFSEDQKEYLHTQQSLSPSLVLMIILSMVLILPFLNLVVYWNEQLRLPDSLSAVEEAIRTMEDQAKEASNRMLITDSYAGFLLNLLIVAVLAAIGEEFVFRGVLQNILARILRNPHAVIWVVAIIFSAMHFQFYGFVPRILLGAYLGYLIYFTGSIWAPVLAHFTNNAFGVVSYYSLAGSEQMDQMDEIGVGSTWWLSLISLFLFFILFFLIRKKGRSENLSS